MPKQISTKKICLHKKRENPVKAGSSKWNKLATTPLLLVLALNPQQEAIKNLHKTNPLPTCVSLYIPKSLHQGTHH